MPMSLLPPWASFRSLLDRGSVCFCFTRMSRCRLMRPMMVAGISMTCMKKKRGTVPSEGNSPAKRILDVQSPIQGTDFAT